MSIIREVSRESQKGFCFPADRHAMTVHEGRKSGLHVIFHVVVNIGNERDCQLKIPHSVGGFIGHVTKINVSARDLNIVERKKKRF